MLVRCITILSELAFRLNMGNKIAVKTGKVLVTKE